MNKIILSLFAFGAIFAFAAGTPTTFRTDILQLGRSATGDKQIQLFRGPSVFSPGFKWNESTSAMQFTNDGSTFFNLVSGVANSVVASKTANYTVVTTDDIVLANAAGGAFTVTLPSAVGNTGKVLTVKKTDSNVFKVTVTGSGGQTIDGQTSFSLTKQYQNLKIVSDGSNWQMQEFDPAIEILTQTGTSTVVQCTPAVWEPLSNNSVTLTSGVWRVRGFVQGQGSNSWGDLRMGWFGANGVGGSSSPLPSAFGGTVLAGIVSSAQFFQNINGTSSFNFFMIPNEVVVRIAEGTTNPIFIDMFVNGCSGAAMTLTTQIIAERVR